MIDLSSVQNLIHGWWFDYDQANFDAWDAYFADDARFSCRSDSGESAIEEFLRADLKGRAEVVAWHVPHRRNSPYPLRHNATNVHLTEVRGDEADFRSYLFVTTVVGGAVVSSASGLCLGTTRIEGGSPRFAAMEVVLDLTDSRTLAELI